MDKTSQQSLDAYLGTVLRDWNAPAIGVGIVEGDKLVFGKGYGFRDYEKKLPFTPTTLFQIASNTKLFTAVAAGILVEEGKLTWDKPVRDAAPAIRFFNDGLNTTVTLRDMLSHRTGITRHDSIWYKSVFSRAELFERLRYLEPQEPLRQRFLYNNLMYAAAGYLIELQSGRSWEEFVRERIFEPLGMDGSCYSVPEMEQRDDHAVPFTEKRDSTEIHRVPHYEDTVGIAPAGAIISNIEAMSHWLTALMNEGRYRGKQVLPAAVLAATLEPAMAIPNIDVETRGFWEVLNATYGMGRSTACYRGRLLTYHGGALGAFFSQVSFMPRERLGVIVFVIGSHCAALSSIVSYNAYEILLGMDQTPWSERLLEIVRKDKKAGTEARAKAGADQVTGTLPSHALEDYTGEYEHPAYGTLRISMGDGQLSFDFHKIHLPLHHYHYDRFDTPDDEIDGKWSVGFMTNPQGEIDQAVMSLDEATAVFRRKPQVVDAAMVSKLAGTYRTPDGFPVPVVLRQDGSLWLAMAGQAEEQLLPYRGLVFRVQRFADVTFEFVLDKGKVIALQQTAPFGEFVFKRD
jgi:CubicO group peptidase (beta-lactamase class C family)